MGSVKLPLEVQKIAWTKTSSSGWATALTDPMYLKAGNTLMLNFKGLEISYNYKITEETFVFGCPFIKLSRQILLRGTSKLVLI